MSQWFAPEQAAAGKEEKAPSSDSKSEGVKGFVQAEFQRARRRSITKQTVGDWAEHLDPSTGKTFWHNETTGVSQWFAPAEASTTIGNVEEDREDEDTDAIVEEEEALRRYAFDREQAEFQMRRRMSVSSVDVGTHWTQYEDADSGDTFWHNSATGVSKWYLDEDEEDEVAAILEEEDGLDDEDKVDQDLAKQAIRYQIASLEAQVASLQFESRQWKAQALRLRSVVTDLRRKDHAARQRERSIQTAVARLRASERLYRARAKSAEATLLFGGFAAAQDGNGGTAARLGVRADGSSPRSNPAPITDYRRYRGPGWN